MMAGQTANGGHRIVRQGNLKLKEHRVLKDSWGKYYFVLKDTPSLVYYKNEGEFSRGTAEPVGSIAVTQATGVGTSPVKGSQQSIRLDTTCAVHELRCATQLDGIEWARLLSDIVLANLAKGGEQADQSRSSDDELGFNQLYAVRPKCFDVDMTSNVLVQYVGRCILEVTLDELVVWKKEGKQRVVLVKWDLRTLRRYSFNEDMFLVESGRRSSTGEGIVVFQTKCGSEISKRMKMVANYQKGKTQQLNRETVSEHTDTSNSSGMTGTSDNAVVRLRAADNHVLQTSLSRTVVSRRYNTQLRRSRSLDDLMCGTHTLPIDMRSPGTTVRSKSRPFAPYHALHHLPSEARPKELDRYHHLEINLRPGTGEGYNHTELKSPRLPYHHLEFGRVNKKDSKGAPAVEASNSEPLYQNLLNQPIQERSGDCADDDKKREDSGLYANVSDIVASFMNQPLSPTNSDYYLEVSEGMESVQLSRTGEEAHRSSGDEKEQHSPLYENFEFGRKSPNIVSCVLPQAGQHELCETSELDTMTEYEDPRSSDVYVNVPAIGVDRRHQSGDIDKTSKTQAWEEKRMAFANQDKMSSGDYSYPVIRSIRGFPKKGSHAQIPIDGDDEECHYYGVDIQMQDESDDIFAVSSNSNTLQSWTVGTPHGVSAAVSDVAAVFPFGDQLTIRTSSQGATSPSSLSAPGSPNRSRPSSPRSRPSSPRSRPPSPAEALHEFNKELQLNVAHRSPTSKRVVTDSSKEEETQDHRRPRAYQMDRRKSDKKLET